MSIFSPKQSSFKQSSQSERVLHRQVFFPTVRGRKADEYLASLAKEYAASGGVRVSPHASERVERALDAVRGLDFAKVEKNIVDYVVKWLKSPDGLASRPSEIFEIGFEKAGDGVRFTKIVFRRDSVDFALAYDSPPTFRDRRQSSVSKSLITAVAFDHSNKSLTVKTFYFNETFDKHATLHTEKYVSERDFPKA